MILNIFFYLRIESFKNYFKDQKNEFITSELQVPINKTILEIYNSLLFHVNLVPDIYNFDSY